MSGPVEVEPVLESSLFACRVPLTAGKLLFAGGASVSVVLCSEVLRAGSSSASSHPPDACPPWRSDATVSASFHCNPWRSQTDHESWTGHHKVVTRTQYLSGRRIGF